MLVRNDVYSMGVTKRIFQRPGKKPDDTTSIPLTHDQLAQIYNVAYQTALGLQLPDEKAKLLAHATVGSLAVAPSSSGDML